MPDLLGLSERQITYLACALDGRCSPPGATKAQPVKSCASSPP